MKFTSPLLIFLSLGALVVIAAAVIAFIFLLVNLPVGKITLPYAIGFADEARFAARLKLPKALRQTTLFWF